MYPVKIPFKITSAYGVPRTLPDGKKDIHSGIDIVNTRNDSTLLACCDCVCMDDLDDYNDKERWTNVHSSVGNRDVFKTIINGDVFYFSYYHTAKNNCSVGQSFKRGDVVGLYGDVGYSFGAHVHLQAWDKNWKTIDPTFLLEI